MEISDNSGRIIVVSNRVPYNIIKSKGTIKYKKSIGGLVTAIDPILSREGGIWIGWNGILKSESSLEKKVNIKNEYGYGKKYELKFIKLTEQDIKNYYHGFSNRTIWPLFHGFIFQTFFYKNYWESYKKVNKKFSQKVLEEIKEDELIWIQDYHLMLLPNFLRKADLRLKLLFFLHIPFPNYEIFRVMPWSSEILKGLLGCNLIGFQTKRDAQNFLTCCDEMINIDTDFKKSKVVFNGREIIVKNFPISIDYNRFTKIAKKEETNKFVKNIKKEYRDVKLIISVERLDYTKGIKERLYSIARFFEKYPEHRKKVIFIQISVPSRTKIKEYIAFKREIDELVGRINGRFADEMWSPINYIYKTIPQPKLIAFYKASDICLVTPLRDGMNLIAKEYVSSKIEGDGVLILSKFAGSAEEMEEYSLMVNPYDIEEVADTIDKAIKMPVEEKKININELRKIVRVNDIFRWSDAFLSFYKKAG